MRPGQPPEMRPDGRSGKVARKARTRQSFVPPHTLEGGPPNVERPRRQQCSRLCAVLRRTSTPAPVSTGAQAKTNTAARLPATGTARQPGNVRRSAKGWVREVGSDVEEPGQVGEGFLAAAASGTLLHEEQPDGDGREDGQGGAEHPAKQSCFALQVTNVGLHAGDCGLDLAKPSVGVGL